MVLCHVLTKDTDECSKRVVFCELCWCVEKRLCGFVPEDFPCTLVVFDCIVLCQNKRRRWRAECLKEDQDINTYSTPLPVRTIQQCIVTIFVSSVNDSTQGEFHMTV